MVHPPTLPSQAQFPLTGRRLVRWCPLVRPAAPVSPSAARLAALPRNTCELHGARPSDACCGFRLGVGSSKDGLAVGAADAVPFVPPWMVSVANAMGEAMCNWEQQQQQGSEGATLPWSMLRLRGSLRTREATAVLTPTMAGMHGAMAVSVTRDEAAALEARLICAAATQGQRISAVLVLVRHSGSVDDHASPAVHTAWGAPSFAAARCQRAVRAARATGPRHWGSKRWHT